jgi:hypothetical protein
MKGWKGNLFFFGRLGKFPLFFLHGGNFPNNCDIHVKDVKVVHESSTEVVRSDKKSFKYPSLNSFPSTMKTRKSDKQGRFFEFLLKEGKKSARGFLGFAMPLRNYKLL